MIVKNAEPFYYPGNSTGCLLIHGFTGAPTEMRPLGEYLADQGYSVLGPRLAGHGTQIEDMNRVIWVDWSNSVLDGWHLLQPLTKRIIIIGLSMGGVLALYHASFLPAAGVVSLSAPFQIEPSLRLTMLPLFSKFITYTDKGKSDWQDPEAVESHFSYARYPTKAILQLNNLLEAMRKSLPKVTIPALLIHAIKDTDVIPENMDLIYRNLGTPRENKKRIWLENSGHVVTLDIEKELVFKSIHEFIQQVLDSQL
ncbi:MAG: alpha/beta hydrolase [Anaerolineales bacterium]